eukprot:gene18204-18056_t
MSVSTMPLHSATDLIGVTLVAADFPGHPLSLTPIMSTTGNRELPTGTPEAMAALSTPAPNPHDDLEGFLAAGLKTARIVGSPDHIDEAALRERMTADVQRSYYPAGFMRQYAAVLASPDRRPKLKGITAPTMVIHGEADTLVNVAGAHDTADNVPGAELKIIPGMGHDVPPAFWDQIVDAIAAALVALLLLLTGAAIWLGASVPDPKSCVVVVAQSLQKPDSADLKLRSRQACKAARSS